MSGGLKGFRRAGSDGGFGLLPIVGYVQRRAGRRRSIWGASARAFSRCRCTTCSRLAAGAADPSNAKGQGQARQEKKRQNGNLSSLPRGGPSVTGSEGDRGRSQSAGWPCAGTALPHETGRKERPSCRTNGARPLSRRTIRWVPGLPDADHHLDRWSRHLHRQGPDDWPAVVSNIGQE